MLLALLALGNISLHAEPQPEGWRFHGYYVAEGEQWFSLQDPSGVGQWVRLGEAGTVRVLHFDSKSAAITVQIGSRTHILQLAQGRIGQHEISREQSSAEAIQSSSTRFSTTAPAIPDERLEPLNFLARASQVEREQSARGSPLPLSVRGREAAQAAEKTVLASDSSHGETSSIAPAASASDPFLGMRRRPITDATLLRVADVIDPAKVE